MIITSLHAFFADDKDLDDKITDVRKFRNSNCKN